MLVEGVLILQSKRGRRSHGRQCLVFSNPSLSSDRTAIEAATARAAVKSKRWTELESGGLIGSEFGERGVWKGVLDEKEVRVRRRSSRRDPEKMKG